MSALNFQHRVEERAEFAEAALAEFTVNAGGHLTGAQSGWFAAGLPEPLGAGGDFADIAPVIEAGGQALSPSALPWTSGVVAPLLFSAAEPPMGLLQELIAGEKVASLPVLTGPHRADAPLLSPDGMTLSGSLLALGPEDGLLVIPIQHASGEILAFVPPEHPGVTSAAITAMDITRPWTRYEIDAVPVANVLTVEVPDLLAKWRSHARVAFSLDSVGAAKAALDATVEYGKVREQFSRPIGSYQAYKHKCASGLVELKLAQSLAYRAASAIANGDAGVSQAATAVLTATSAKMICASAIQLHGGMGYSWELGVHRFLRRVRANEILSDIPQATQDLIDGTLARLGAE